MWRKIPCGRGSFSAPKTGPIRACARILPGETMGSPASGRFLDRPPRFADLLEGEAAAAALVRLRRNELIGRPLGSPGFVAEIESASGATLAPGKRGRKPRNQAAADQ